jgi:putative ABC transport system substrate-binding protein
MNRRELMLLLVGAMTAPRALRAQQKAMPVIGLVSPFSRADTELWHQAFRQGLRDLGWFEGVNVGIEYRFAEARMELCLSWYPTSSSSRLTLSSFL